MWENQLGSLQYLDNSITKLNKKPPYLAKRQMRCLFPNVLLIAFHKNDMLPGNDYISNQAPLKRFVCGCTIRFFPIVECDFCQITNSETRLRFSCSDSHSPPVHVSGYDDLEGLKSIFISNCTSPHQTVALDCQHYAMGHSEVNVIWKVNGVLETSNETKVMNNTYCSTFFCYLFCWNKTLM